ncbi:MAG: HDOD domain-containing protein, partial [Planctomycetes bacterium]|nr:HDOD domain-containing protein [Planctomycetota bacterium]
VGLDRLVGPHQAFINLTREFFVQGLYESLPKERVVLEVLEDIEPDAEFVAAVRAAKQAGYTIALDDFRYSEAWDPLVEIADLIKLDVVDLGRMETVRHIRLLARPGLRFLAEKVETHADFEFYRRLGVELFQGFFFCEPQVVAQRALPQNKLAMLELLGKVHDPSVDIESVVDTIVRDVSMSYRLLRSVNSSLFALPREIESVHQAVVLLGLGRVRSLCTLLMMAAVDDKPLELTVTGLVRARTCQSLGRSVGADEQMFFSVGLLSVLDALLDRPMAELLDQMPLSETVRAAILDEQGPAGEALRLARACERMDLDMLRDALVSVADVREAFIEALGWAREAMSIQKPQASSAG